MSAIKLLNATIKNSVNEFEKDVVIKGKLEVEGKGVSGSTSIAKSRFHMPKLTGKYAVDLHNVTKLVQFPTSVPNRRSRHTQKYLDMYGATTIISDHFTTFDETDSDGNVESFVNFVKNDVTYKVPADSFYDPEKQLLVTGPMVMSMSIYLPNTSRDKDEDFQYFDGTINYGAAWYSGSVWDAISSDFRTSGSRFATEDPTADDSLFQFVLNTDLSSYGFELSDNISVFSSATAIKQELTRLLDLAVDNVDLQKVLEESKSFKKLMTFKWHVKRFPIVPGTYHTSMDTTHTPENCPLFFAQGYGPAFLSDVASNGFISIDFNCEYSGNAKRDPGNLLPVGAGAVFNNYGSFGSYSSYSVYDRHPNRMLNGITSIDQAQYVLGTMHDMLEEIGILSKCDTSKVNVDGLSGNGMYSVAANYNNPEITHFEFASAIATDPVFASPFYLGYNQGSYWLSAAHDKTLYRWYDTGFQIPTLIMEQHHNHYRFNSNSGTVGNQVFAQSAYRKTNVAVRSQCIYHEYGNHHVYYVDEPEIPGQNKHMIAWLYMQPVAAGFDYPNDSINNLSLENANISTEALTVYEAHKLTLGRVAFLLRNNMKEDPISLERIQQLLPGKTTLSPYTFEEAAEYSDTINIRDTLTIGNVSITGEQLQALINNMPKNLAIVGDSTTAGFSMDAVGAVTYTKFTQIKNTNYYLQGSSPYLLGVPNAFPPFDPSSISDKHEALLFKLGIEDILVYLLGAVQISAGDPNTLQTLLSDAQALPFVDLVYSAWVQAIEYFVSKNMQVYCITGQYIHKPSDPEYNLFGVMPRGIEVITYYETKQIEYCKLNNIEYISERAIFESATNVDELFGGSVMWLAAQGIDPALIASYKDVGHPVKAGYRHFNKQLYDFLLPLVME